MPALAELSSLDLPSIHSWENVNGSCMEDAEETKTISKHVANVLRLVLILLKITLDTQIQYLRRLFIQDNS